MMSLDCMRVSLKVLHALCGDVFFAFSDLLQNTLRSCLQGVHPSYLFVWLKTNRTCLKSSHNIVLVHGIAPKSSDLFSNNVMALQSLLCNCRPWGFTCFTLSILTHLALSHTEVVAGSHPSPLCDVTLSKAQCVSAVLEISISPGSVFIGDTHCYRNLNSATPPKDPNHPIPIDFNSCSIILKKRGEILQAGSC